MIDLHGARRMSSEHDTIGISAKICDIVTDPLQCLVDIEDTKILRSGCILKLGGVGIREDTLARVEADKDDALASKVGADELRIAA
jgi:hypothetical protein